MIHAKNIELMYFPEFLHELARCGAITHFPTRIVKGLAEGCDQKASVSQIGIAGNAVVPFTVLNHMLIDLITQHNDRTVTSDVFQLLHVLLAEHRTRWVMG